MDQNDQAETIRAQMPDADDLMIMRTQAMGAAIFDLIRPKSSDNFADSGVSIGIALGKLMAHLSPDANIQERAIDSILAVAAAQVATELARRKARKAAG
jgi:hypothetical protein